MDVATDGLSRATARRKRDAGEAVQRPAANDAELLPRIDVTWRHIVPADVVPTRPRHDPLTDMTRGVASRICAALRRTKPYSPRGAKKSMDEMRGHGRLRMRARGVRLRH